MCITNCAMPDGDDGPRPTDETYQHMQLAYDHFNQTLFDGRLNLTGFHAGVFV